jgi:hypothetical protein
MIKKIAAIMTILGFLFSPCHIHAQKNKVEGKKSSSVELKTKMTDVAFTLVENYFVKNTVTELSNPKIETKSKFDEVFGMAPFMGDNGKPTLVDFSKKYVITVILPETDLETKIEPVSLQKDKKGNLTLTYKISIGQKQSYTTRPNFAIMVDKSEKGKVTLKEIK